MTQFLKNIGCFAVYITFLAKFYNCTYLLSVWRVLALWVHITDIINTFHCPSFSGVICNSGREWREQRKVTELGLQHVSPNVATLVRKEAAHLVTALKETEGKALDAKVHYTVFVTLIESFSLFCFFFILCLQYEIESEIFSSAFNNF